MSNNRQKNGFTLIELLLVVLILGFLALMVIPRISESAEGAKKATCDTNVASLNRTIERYALNEDAYPTATAFTNVVMSSSYFPHGTPVCPFTTAYAYNASTYTVAFHGH